MQLKRILAIFLAAALIFSVPVVSFGAESTETFEVGVVAETTTPVSSSPVIYNSGEEVSVKISADKNTGVIFLRFQVYFNPEALEYIGYTSDALFENEYITVVDAEKSYINYFSLMNKASSATGNMFTLNFKIKETFCGNVDLSAKIAFNEPDESDCMNESYNFVPFVGGKDSFAVHTVDVSTGVVTAPTCTEEGYTTYHCSLCDKDVAGNIVPANGHTEAQAVVENRVEPTCLENGSYDSVVYCSVCEAELSRTKHSIDALGHDIVNHEKKDPTCALIGWEAYETCSRCDYTTYVEIPAHGQHTYDNACDTTCNVCDGIREVEPHVYDNACDTTCNICQAVREVEPHV